jgi:nitrite reductase (NO-forming)
VTLITFFIPPVWHPIGKLGTSRGNNIMNTTRRGFLKGAAGAVGAAALMGLQQHTDHILAGIVGDVKTAYARQGTFPTNTMGAELPAPTTEINLHTPHITKEIAPGIAYDVWSYEGSGPGPHLCVQEGELIKFSLTNDDMHMQHSIDFHAAQLPWDKYYQSVNPGETLSFEWQANFPGVFMYHCGTPPVLAHIANGMHGAIVVQPKNGWAEPAREYVLVQHEWYLGDANEEGVRAGNTQKMSAGTPDMVVFNGYLNQYQTNPLVADPGELIRLYVCNCGPTLWSAFHVIGALFEAAYPDGNPLNKQLGMQTVSIPPGGGYTVELRIPDEGYYPFVTHSFAYTGRGALGVIKVGNPTTELGAGGH